MGLSAFAEATTSSISSSVSLTENWFWDSTLRVWGMTSDGGGNTFGAGGSVISSRSSSESEDTTRAFASSEAGGTDAISPNSKTGRPKSFSDGDDRSVGKGTVACVGERFGPALAIESAVSSLVGDA